MFDPTPMVVAQTTHHSVNGERLLLLADSIENNSLGLAFDMNLWYERYWWSDSDCQTVACIGGTGCLLAFGESRENDKDIADWLGLDYYLAQQLFYPFGLSYSDGERREWETVTRQEAAAVIRHLAYTGRVDWGLAE